MHNSVRRHNYVRCPHMAGNVPTVGLLLHLKGDWGGKMQAAVLLLELNGAPLGTQ